jgi:hypothetical protein
MSLQTEITTAVSVIERACSCRSLAVSRTFCGQGAAGQAQDRLSSYVPRATSAFGDRHTTH